MKRYIGYVESIDWTENTCKLRIPNLDGLGVLAYVDPAIAMLRQLRTKTEDLIDADIPYHLQGLRIGDIVYCLLEKTSGEQVSDCAIVGFFGGTVENE